MATKHVIPGGGGDATTIAGGLALLSAGDLLYLHVSNYNERIDFAVSNVPGGSSWATATTIAAFPGDTVNIKPLTQNGQSVLFMPRPDQSSGQINEWVTWQDLVFDGTNVIGGGIVQCGQSHNRFLRCEVKNNGAGGSNPTVNAAVSIGGQAGAPVIGVEFSGGSCHDNALITGTQNGINAPYGFYVSRASDTIIERMQIYRNGGYGIHGYSSAGDHQRSIFRYNVLFDNQLFALNQEAAHILASQGDFHQVLGNVIYQTTGTPPLNGIIVQSSGRTLIANNTIVNMPRAGIFIAAGGFNTQVVNNICVDSDQNSGGFKNIDDTGTGTTFSKNLCRGSGGTDHAEFTFDPLFVSP